MIPDTLIADHSEKYKVSIRLTPDGLSFWGYIPSERERFFMESFTYDPNLSKDEALKSIFFQNPCFSFIYQSFDVICASGKYTMVSEPVFVDSEKEKLFFFCHPKDHSLKILAQPLSSFNATMLFGVEKEIYAFLLRSLASPRFIHSLSPLLVAWQKKSRLIFPKLMHVVLNRHTMDVFCVGQGDLLFVNSYSYDNANDIIYYIMYICKQINFNQLDDFLTISGKKSVCMPALSVIKKYIRQSEFLQPQLYGCRTALDDEMTLEIITLIECGV